MDGPSAATTDATSFAPFASADKPAATEPAAAEEAPAAGEGTTAVDGSADLFGSFATSPPPMDGPSAATTDATSFAPFASADKPTTNEDVEVSIPQPRPVPDTTDKTPQETSSASEEGAGLDDIETSADSPTVVAEPFGGCVGDAIDIEVQAREDVSSNDKGVDGALSPLSSDPNATSPLSQLSDVDSDAVPFATPNAAEIPEAFSLAAHDDFGTFGSAEFAVMTTNPDAGNLSHIGTTMTPAASDDVTSSTFGAAAITAQSDFGNFGSTAPAEVETSGDEWGAFGAPADAGEGGKSASTSDDWGVFGGGPSSGSVAETTSSDDWGSFGGGEITAAVSTDEWGAFGQPEGQRTVSTRGNDGFGAFGSSSHQGNNDDFGELGSVGTSAPAPAPPVNQAEVVQRLRDQLAQIFSAADEDRNIDFVAAHSEKAVDIANSPVWKRVERLRESMVMAWRGSHAERMFASAVNLDLNSITELDLDVFQNSPHPMSDQGGELSLDMLLSVAPGPSPSPTLPPTIPATASSGSLLDGLTGLVPTAAPVPSEDNGVGADGSLFGMAFLGATSDTAAAMTAVKSPLDMSGGLFAPSSEPESKAPDFSSTLGADSADLFSPPTSLVPGPAVLSEEAKRIIAQMPDLSFMVPMMAII